MELFHRDLGGAGRPPLVILHGLLGSSRNWQTAGADLTSDYHVFALDLRNHGQSPHDPVMSYEAMAGDVLQWMESRDMARVSLLGHSMGGKVAMHLACRHAARVERLFVVDIAPKVYRSDGHRAEFAAMNELELRSVTSRGEAEMRFEARVGDWAMRKFLATNLVRDDSGAWSWQINLPALTEALPRIEANPLMAEDQFTGPTVFVAGGRSNYITQDDLPAIHSHFPAATLITLPNSGHNPHIESRPDFVNAVLDQSRRG